MKTVASLLETKFKKLYKKESALQIIEKKDRFVVNNFLSVYQDVDGEYSVEYERDGDIYMESATSRDDLIARVIGLVIEQIAFQVKAPPKRARKTKTASV